ncbi:MAG: amidohydrolase family protein [Rhizobiales bacterium]|nr:amidohydrolase family protein [Hyphomicrobiales bacterium]
MRIIDAHTHYYPGEWVALIEREAPKHGAKVGRDGNDSVTFALGGLSATFSREYDDLEHRIAYMDGVGVDMHVLSLMAPLVDWAPAAFALDLAQTYNDASARACERYPARFAGMAVVPMHEPALAVRELDRVKNHAGMCGLIEDMRKNGMEVNVLTKAQRETFRKQVAPVWKEWESKLPPKWIDRARQAVS